ncbi:hypothetical protein DQG23_36510 [Paenibacillus contaminans]|uniref:Uncharacterized protein n=1 Tax=Paenibacillus contaminans TaxID=450362 RepID=A0A329M2S0_9BACL|nr:hypothetical protein DQG23_36510 [Paenibacillus contaminans]
MQEQADSSLIYTKNKYFFVIPLRIRHNSTKQGDKLSGGKLLRMHARTGGLQDSMSHAPPFFFPINRWLFYNLVKQQKGCWKNGTL